MYSTPSIRTRLLLLRVTSNELMLPLPLLHHKLINGVAQRQRLHDDFIHFLKIRITISYANRAEFFPAASFLPDPAG
jgi:hypothetical protein